MRAEPWEETITRFLISKGVDGIKQSDLIYKFYQIVSAEEMLPWLEQLKEERKVDRFIVPTKGRPATWWRATTLILTD